MCISSLNARPPGREEFGVVYASAEGVNKASYEGYLEKLIHKAHGLGATALVALQLVQSQFRWNQRTSLLASAAAAPRRSDTGIRAGRIVSSATSAPPPTSRKACARAR